MSLVLTLVPTVGSQFTLDEIRSTRVRRGVTGMDVPPADVTSAPYLSADGSSLTSVRRPPADMLIPLLLTEAPEGGDLQSTIKQLSTVFRYGPVTLQANRPGLNARERLNVVYVSGLEGDLSAASGLNDTWRKVVLSLRALDPWWYGDTETITLGFGSSVPFDSGSVPFDDASTNFDGLESVPSGIGGDTIAYPTVTFEGPFTTCYVGKSDSAERVELAGALAEGDTITVDSRPGSRGPRLNNGPVDWSLITPDSRLLTINPLTDGGSGGVRLFASATGDTGASNLEVSYRMRWATVQ